MTDCKTITKEEYIAKLENQVAHLKQNLSGSKNGFNKLQRKLSLVTADRDALSGSATKPVTKTTWKQLFTYWSGSVIVGFGFGLGFVGSLGWVKFIGDFIYG